jgi:hypothetical protein
MIGARLSLLLVAIFVKARERVFCVRLLKNKEDYSARNKNDKNTNTRFTLLNDFLTILIVLN